MAEIKTQRKLTAILSADVKGYSKLMGDDDESTVNTITAYRKIISELINKHQGRVVDTPGDNILAEFSGALNAVHSAIEIQQKLETENGKLTANRRMDFRIGINLGDVLHKEDRIYGDGVNVAARIESLADPGGVCISRGVFDQVKKKVRQGFEYMGEHTVKNISEPVRIYRILFQSEFEGKVLEESSIWKVKRKKSFAITIAVILVCSSVLLWFIYYRPIPIEPASIEKMVYPLPEKPSIAVLPFVNMSDDKQQEYFSDGITEDIITDLSANPELFVIARNSTFAYKGKSVKIRQIAEELGVKFVLEGSVRKSGNKVRINAQLIDATDGHHLWAERYDGQLIDVFVLQDTMSNKIVSALNVKLSDGDKKSVDTKETDNIDAYDAFLKGWNYYRRNTREDWAKAILLFEKAINFDPKYTRAHAAISLIYWRYSRTTMSYFPDTELLGINYAEARARAREYLDLAMKQPTTISYRVAASMALYRRQFRKAYELAEKAVELAPNDVDGIYNIGYISLASGEHAKAVNLIEKGMRLDPHNIAEPLYLIGIVNFANGQFENAVSFIERALTHNPKLPISVPILPAALSLLGQDQKAQLSLEKLKKSNPLGYKFQQIMFNFPFSKIEVIDSFVNGLRRAGLFATDYKYYKFSNENMLNEEQMRKLFFGKKVTGSYSTILKKSSFYIERKVDGKAIWTVPLSSLDHEDSGKSWIEDDMLCDQWNIHFFGLKHCMSVFRNPEGGADKKNEYIAVTDSEFIPIGLVE